MSVPHHKFVGRWCGEGKSRRKHNGRLRRLPHMGQLRVKQRRDMDRMDWLAGGSDDAIRWMVRHARPSIFSKGATINATH